MQSEVTGGWRNQKRPPFRPPVLAQSEKGSDLAVHAPLRLGTLGRRRVSGATSACVTAPLGQTAVAFKRVAQNPLNLAVGAAHLVVSPSLNGRPYLGVNAERILFACHGGHLLTARWDAGRPHAPSRNEKVRRVWSGPTRGRPSQRAPAARGRAGGGRCRARPLAAAEVDGLNLRPPA